MLQFNLKFRRGQAGLYSVMLNGTDIGDIMKSDESGLWSVQGKSCLQEINIDTYGYSYAEAKQATKERIEDHYGMERS